MQVASLLTGCVVLLASLSGNGAGGADDSEAGPTPLARLPMDLNAAKADWQIIVPKASSEPQPVPDDLLGRNVWEVGAAGRCTFASKQVFQGPYAVTGWVRFTDQLRKPGMAVLACGVQGDEAEAMATYWLTLTGGVGTAEAFSLVGACQAGPGRRPGAWGQGHLVRPRFSAADVSPVMNESFRIELENAIAQYPAPHRYWRRLRIEVRPDFVRMYHNGYLLLEEANALISDGRVRLAISGSGVRVAGIEVLPLPGKPGPFYPVCLDDLCNKKGPADAAALGRPGEPTRLAQLPVLLPRGSGGDHVDVGESLFCYRMETGYQPAAHVGYTCPDANLLDPAGLRLRVPMRAYRRAWVLAASSGDPLHVPLVTLRFYHPGAGWWIDASAKVPEFRVKDPPLPARPVPVKLSGGRDGNLWLVPIELDSAAIASEFRGQSVMTAELTKEVKDHITFPDPCAFGSYPAGLPSAVQIYGLTLEEAPIRALASGRQTGNVYVYPEKPQWIVRLASQSAADVQSNVQISVHSPYGSFEVLDQELTVPAGRQSEAVFCPVPREYGLYRVTTQVRSGDWSQSSEGAFLILPQAQRQARREDSPWGAWIWAGGHGTIADPADVGRLMNLLGLRIGCPKDMHDPGRAPAEFRQAWQLGPNHYRIIPRTPPPWVNKDPVDPAEYAAFVEGIAAKAVELKTKYPDLQYVNCLAENSISLRTTHGMPPYAFGEPWFDYTGDEKDAMRKLWLASVAGNEGVKRSGAKLKYVFGHCSPSFFLPFFRDPVWNNDLFDGLGLDMPQFVRMPERPPRAVEPSSLYFLYQEMKDRKIRKELVHLESYFPSSHRLAMGHRAQADSVVRTAVLALAMGTSKFMACWSLDDCAGYWGSQQYGCCGFFGRPPESRPKPAAAAMATMTSVLDQADYDGWLPTGSRSAFCVRFQDRHRRRLIYCVWTVRGTRPLELTAGAKTSLIQVDENGNQTRLTPAEGKAAVTLSPTPLWLVATGGAIEKVQVGPPRYVEAPSPHRMVLDDFEKADWRVERGTYEPFQSHHWDVVREPVELKSHRVASAERGTKVWRIAMEEIPAGKPLVGFYGVFQPPRPIVLPGKPRALGLYANGRSAWNRVVYELIDAKGEQWLACGTKDAWNCDDPHSWSYLNFDGWRYMEFPLPGNSPGDNFREKNSVWWGHSAEGIVDLPLRLSRIIVSMSTHIIYVNEMLPVDDLAIELDDLMAVYDAADDRTDAPVKLQQSAAMLLKPKPGGAGLPNPHQRLQTEGAWLAPEIVRLYPPDPNDGQQIYVEIKPARGAENYLVYVSAYPDGRGAKPMGRPVANKPSTVLLGGLQPGIPLYLFATYADAGKKESQPSPLRKTVLKDEFPMK